MKKRLFSGVVIGIVMLALLMVPQAVQAQEGGNLRLGSQYSHPYGGFSAIYDLGDAFSVQGMVGWNSLAGKAIIRVRQEPYWNIYGYGGAGLNFLVVRPGAMAGAGVEFDWRQFGIDFGEIIGWEDRAFTSNLELGIGVRAPRYDWENIRFGMNIGSGFHISF